MDALAGLVASLVVAHGGTNGFDPKTVYLLWELGAFKIADSDVQEDFAKWLDVDREERASTVDYFVRCAFKPTTVIRFRGYQWQGVYGLARSNSLKQLLQSIASAKSPTQLLLDAEDQKWVSSCLMAFANAEGLHEYVSLRGKPLSSTVEERWARGYEEGVFFADVLALVGSTDPIKVLERSYTLSLHAGGNTECIPPLVSRGRVYDFDRETLASYNGIRYRVARRLDSPASKIVEPAAEVCVDGDPPSVVPCRGKGMSLRPLWIYLPWLVSLVTEKTKSNSAPIEAISTGSLGVGGATMACRARDEACQGPFALEGACQDPTAKTVLELRNGHKIEVVLHHRGSAAGAAKPSPGQAFTALVLYRSKTGGRAEVEVMDRSGGWRSAGKDWPPTDDTWRWMQVFPAYPVKDASGAISLRMRISGPAEGEAGPLVNVAGFVDGPPWCRRGEPQFMCWCHDGEPAIRSHACKD